MGLIMCYPSPRRSRQKHRDLNRLCKSRTSNEVSIALHQVAHQSSVLCECNFADRGLPRILEQPCLIVNDLKLGETHGQVGFWGQWGTDAYFSRLTIQSDR